MKLTSQASIGSSAIVQRKLGSTGLETSVLGFGTGDNAGLMTIGSHKDQKNSVFEAIDAGINYFDTSPDYGRGRAEENLGRALAGVRHHVLVTTKVEFMPADRHRLAKKVIESVDQSLRRLRTDYVDIVMIHNQPGKEHMWDRTTWTPLDYSDFTRENGALEGLAKVIASGKVRFGGIACEDADPTVVCSLVSQPTVQVLNVWLNLLNPSSLLDSDAATITGPADYRGIAKAAAASGVGVAGFRALGGGALMSAAANTFHRHPIAGGGFTRNPSVYQREVELAGKFVKRLGIHSVQEMAELAYRFNISDPRVTTTVGGYSERAHLRSAVAAMEKGPLPAGQIKEIFSAWRELFTGQ